MATPITTLELRTVHFPRSGLLELLSRELGRPITHEQRHFLAGQPVSCGAILEYFDNGNWVAGRYEWSTNQADRADLHMEDRIVPITPDCLLRWPK